MDERPKSRNQLFLAGAIAGVLGIATSELAVGLLHQTGGPVVAVAGAARDLTPGAIAVPLIHLVRHLDKPLLLAGTAVGLLALSGLAGLQNLRRPWLSYLIFALMGAAAAAAVLTRDNAGPYDVVPVLVGFVTWLVALPWLTAPTVVPDGRRAFLLRAGLGAGGTVAAIALGRVLSKGRAKVEQARDLLRLPATRGTVPAGADLGVSDQPWRTPSDSFYQIDTAIALPQITPDQWELRIHGLVDKPMTITYQDLVDRRLTESWITLCCVSNEVGGDLIGNAFWSGVPIRDLLAEAGVQSGADAVKQTSSDGWTCGTPIGALTDPTRDAMLAIAMNGRPLPVEHGFPVRMVVPGLYGYVSATKWVVDLEVTRFADFSAYWTQRGWGPLGPVKTESRVDVPRDGDAIQSGTSAIGGSAWAQHTGIGKVEVQVDGGAWQEAELGAVPSDDCWVQWKLSADLKKGRHTVAVRATDKSGYTQTAARAGVLPDGATGWDTVRFEAV